MPDSFLKNSVLGIEPQTFNDKALEIFRYQAEHVPVYREYLRHLNTKIADIQRIEDIPFLPVETFKNQEVLAEGVVPVVTFRSSSTTGTGESIHHIDDPEFYRSASLQTFGHFYGDISGYCVLALLPSYLERGNSSLVFMADHFIRQSGHPRSGFFLNQLDELAQTLRTNEAEGQRTLLLGVSYALLDFAALYPIALSHTLIMETGGMKGRKKEMIRQELHNQLKQAFSVQHIHAEYGMTELLSQAYSTGDGLFDTMPWMQVLIREVNDPFSYSRSGKTGGINIIDLLNIHSCSFLATSDLGRKHPDGRFEVLGRFDFSDTRGCSLLAI